jgi:hypothetical protein
LSGCWFKKKQFGLSKTATFQKKRCTGHQKHIFYNLFVAGCGWLAGRMLLATARSAKS